MMFNYFVLCVFLLTEFLTSLQYGFYQYFFFFSFPHTVYMRVQRLLSRTYNKHVNIEN